MAASVALMRIAEAIDPVIVHGGAADGSAISAVCDVTQKTWAGLWGESRLCAAGALSGEAGEVLVAGTGATPPRDSTAVIAGAEAHVDGTPSDASLCNTRLA